LAVVLLNGNNVNLEMVKAGWRKSIVELLHRNLTTDRI
jgi:endonuclease YncB( thermonuclease family)